MEKREKQIIAFYGDNCVTNASDFCLNLKGEEREDNKNQNLEYKLQLHAQYGSEFYTWIVLNILSFDKRTVNFIENCKGNIELKVFN